MNVDLLFCYKVGQVPDQFLIDHWHHLASHLQQRICFGRHDYNVYFRQYSATVGERMPIIDINKYHYMC